MPRKSRKDVDERVTAQIIKMLENEQLPPWRSPSFTGSVLPINATSKRQYRGINIWTLASEAMMKGYEDNRWLTFKQEKSVGGYIRKGEKSTPVVFWKIIEIEDEYDIDETKSVPISYLYNVFNVLQTKNCDLPEYVNLESIDHDSIQSAESIIENMPLMPNVEHMHVVPQYSFDRDVIALPNRETWKNIEEYYHTLYHEMAHSTGHSKRMGRIDNVEALTNKKSVYAQEELIAEMTAAILCGHAGVGMSDMENSASYISTWLKNFKDNPNILMIASQQSQHVADYILRRDNEHE